MMHEPSKEILALKYRPQDWSQFVGNANVIASIRRAIAERTSHSFLFIGPSGVGKTSLARIIAREVGCGAHDLIEIDAATYTGIDAMREVTTLLSYCPLSSNGARVVIIDEAHALSKPAWSSLLKSIEEPSSYAWWILCTTEGAKIPETIRTRCLVYELRPISSDAIAETVRKINRLERLNTSPDVIEWIAETCGGSLRRAISWLGQVAGISTIRDAAEIIARHGYDGGPESPGIVLARDLVAGRLTWLRACQVLSRNDLDAESIRIAMVRYLAKVALSAKTNDAAGRVLEWLDCFSTPYQASDGMAPLLLSLGRIIFVCLRNE